MSRFFSKKGAATDDDDDADRSNLFGNRTAQKPLPNSNDGGYAVGNPYAPQRGGDDLGYGATPPPRYSSRADNGYGGSSTTVQNPFAPQRGGDDGRYRQDPNYGHRQQQQYYEQSGGYGQPGDGQQSDLSEDKEIESVKKKTKEIRYDSLLSTRNALKAGEEAIETSMRTFGHLGTQAERLYNIDKNLNNASNQTKITEKDTRELKNLNRGMFRPNMSGPTRSGSRAQEEAKILAHHQLEREERDRTWEFGYNSKNVVGKAYNTTNGRVESKGQSSPAGWSATQFEPDSEDESAEKEIDANLDRLGAITGRLNGMAVAAGKEVERQNQQIDKIMKKSDRVDDQIALNHNRIRKIH